MCGITAVIPLNVKGLKVSEMTRRRLAVWFNTELLEHTIERGKHATGVTASFLKDPENWESAPAIVCKQPVKADDFFLNDGSFSYKYKNQKPEASPVEVHKRIASDAGLKFNFIIGHTRHRTQGDESNFKNNHPIVVNNIIGIQNGGVDNDDLIFELHKDEMTRHGEVDSEAIIQLLSVHSNDQALNWDSINYVTQRMQGPRAVIAYNASHPENVIFFRNTKRPLELYFIKELGFAVICSKTEYMSRVKEAYSRLRMSFPEAPKIDPDYVNVQPDFGGVISVRAEFDGESVSDFREFISLKKYETNTIEEYDLELIQKRIREAKEAKEKAEKAEKEAKEKAEREAKEEERKKTQASNSQTQTSTGGSKQQTSSAASSANSNALVSSSNAVVTDLSDYGTEDTIVDSDTDDNIEIDAEAIMDDGSPEEAFTSAEELRAIAMTMLSSDKFLEDESLIINRTKEFKDIFGKDFVNEKDAMTVLGNIYPEVFTEGFIKGHDYAELKLAEDYSEDFDALEVELRAKSSKEVEAYKEKLSRASSIVGNLKVFLVALMKSKGVVEHVEENEGNKILYFTKEVERNLDFAEDNLQLNVNKVIDLLKNSDYRQIKKAVDLINKQNIQQ